MATQERAVLAGGCFWGMQDLIRKMPGVSATRVGYTGGDVANATYRNHGTHAEGIEIMFDPAVVSLFNKQVADHLGAPHQRENKRPQFRNAQCFRRRTAIEGTGSGE